MSHARPSPVRLLTTDEAAKLLQLSASTLATWRCRRSDGPPYIRIGRYPRYDERDLLEWIDSRRRRSTSGPGMAPDLSAPPASTCSTVSTDGSTNAQLPARRARRNPGAP